MLLKMALKGALDRISEFTTNIYCATLKQFLYNLLFGKINQSINLFQLSIII